MLQFGFAPFQYRFNPIRSLAGDEPSVSSNPSAQKGIFFYPSNNN